MCVNSIQNNHDYEFHHNLTYKIFDYFFYVLLDQIRATAAQWMKISALKSKIWALGSKHLMRKYIEQEL